MAVIFLEKEEALRRYKRLVATRVLVIPVFLLVPLILKEFFRVPVPIILFLLLAWMPISTIIYDFFLRQIKGLKASQIVNGYFAYSLSDLIIFTIILYILGGITWIGFIFYALYIYTAGLLFPRPYYFFYVFYCSFLSTLLIVIQYLEIFPSQFIFPLEERVPQNLYYAFSTWLAAVTFLWLLGLYGDNFYRLLQGKIEELQKTRKIVEKEKASLEVKVQARTLELTEERKGLAEKVRERTKELAQRISELEEFHKVAVGRELKMIELKKEITELKKKITKQETS